MTLSPTNPMRPAAMSVPIFEILVTWLAFIGMLQVESIHLGIAAAACGVVTVLCLAATAGLRRGWGYLVGWVAQVAIIALGLLTPWMYAMGIIFALIWVTCVVLGRRIEKHQQGGVA